MNNIKLNGKVSIQNGDNNIQYGVPNHIVNNLYRGLFSVFMINYIYANDASYYYLPANNWYIHLGTGNTLITDPSTTSLESEIAIEPNIKQILTDIDDTNGIYKITYRCIWNAGVITDTIEEMGLYMRLGTYSSVFSISNTTITPSVKLASRLATTDGNLTQFTPNLDYPLIINWEFTISL